MDTVPDPRYSTSTISRAHMMGQNGLGKKPIHTGGDLPNQTKPYDGRKQPNPFPFDSGFEQMCFYIAFPRRIGDGFTCRSIHYCTVPYWSHALQRSIESHCVLHYSPAKAFTLFWKVPNKMTFSMVYYSYYRNSLHFVVEAVHVLLEE